MRGVFISARDSDQFLRIQFQSRQRQVFIISDLYALTFPVAFAPHLKRAFLSLSKEESVSHLEIQCVLGINQK